MVGDPGVSPIVPPRKTLCPTSPSLQWVPWASVPHLLSLTLLPGQRYYDPLRLPKAHPRFVRYSLSAPDTLRPRLPLCSISGSYEWHGELASYARDFVYGI